MISGIASIAISFAAFTLIALTMEKHSLQMCEYGVKGKEMLFGCSGWAVVALSVFPCLQGWNGGLALVAWFGCVSLSGSFLSLMLAYIPLSVPAAAKAAGGTGLLLLIVNTLI